MTNDKHPHGIQPEQASKLVNEIAALACTVGELCGEAAESANDDPKLTGTLAHSAEALSQQIGYLADLASQLLGGPIFKGDASAWMTPAGTGPDAIRTN